MFASWKKSNDKPIQCIKKQRGYFADKGPYSQSCGFTSSHVWMWELDSKKGWAPKNSCLRTVVLKKTLESRLDNKEIKPLNPKGNQPWISLEGLMLKLKLQYFDHLMQRADSLERTQAGKDWRQKEKGMAEDEMVGWHHWLNGHELKQALGNSEGQRSLACCSPQGRKELNMTEQPNNKNYYVPGNGILCPCRGLCPEMDWEWGIGESSTKS